MQPEYYVNGRVQPEDYVNDRVQSRYYVEDNVLDIIYLMGRFVGTPCISPTINLHFQGTISNVPELASNVL